MQALAAVLFSTLTVSILIENAAMVSRPSAPRRLYFLIATPSGRSVGGPGQPDSGFGDRRGREGDNGDLLTAGRRDGENSRSRRLGLWA